MACRWLNIRAGKSIRQKDRMQSQKKDIYPSFKDVRYSVSLDQAFFKDCYKLIV